MSSWATLPLRDRVINLDKRRVPVRASDRRPGPYPYYGASGIVDRVDGFLFEGPHLLIAEDGENLRTRKTPVAFLADGRFWVNNHAHVVVGNEGNDTRFLAYAVESSDISGLLSGSTQPKLTQDALGRLLIRAPELPEQRGIAATLGALDDKIESNRRIVSSARSLGHALLAERHEGGERVEMLGQLVASIARGAAPRYADDDPSAALVLNQKCIRDGLVSTAQARRTEPRQLTAEKKARHGDLLVNSTGTGTLGRVGRWWGDEVFVDSHVTVVRPLAMACPPTVLAYALLAAQLRIENLATGSTGQTELSRDRLGALPVTLPASDLSSLESELLALEDRLEAARRESASLAALRDALLPELMSGRIRVPEAREAVDNAVG